MSPPEVKLLICHNFQVFLLLLSASVDLLQSSSTKILQKGSLAWWRSFLSSFNSQNPVFFINFSAEIKTLKGKAVCIFLSPNLHGYHGLLCSNGGKQVLFLQKTEGELY